MSTLTKSFTALGAQETSLSVKAGDKFTYSVSGTFSATVKLQRSIKGNQVWSTVATLSGAGSGTVLNDAPSGTDASYRFFCSAFTSGTVVCSLTTADSDSQPILKNRYGETVVSYSDETVTVLKPLSQPLLTSSGVGSVNGATVSAVEYGEGVVHKTVLTLASTPISVVSVTTGNGVGGTKIYDLPEGRILVLGAMADLSLAVETESDFADGTPEGDIGIGTVAPANADALGTDATDDDMATATAFTMTDYAATVKCPSEASAQFDGTGTAKDIYVNALVDAADIDDDTTTNLLVSGTVTVTWINLGDF